MNQVEVTEVPVGNGIEFGLSFFGPRFQKGEFFRCNGRVEAEQLRSLVLKFSSSHLSSFMVSSGKVESEAMVRNSQSIYESNMRDGLAELIKNDGTVNDIRRFHGLPSDPSLEFVPCDTASENSAR